VIVHALLLAISPLYLVEQVNGPVPALLVVAGVWLLARRQVR